MTNEIKEILDRLKDKNNYISHSMILLSIKEITTILDYITNLQEENERLKEQLFDFKQNIYIQKAGIPQKMTKDKTFMDLYDMPTYEDYKSRNEKAIEYIDNHLRMESHYGIQHPDFEGTPSYDFSCWELLDILRGDA